MVEKRKPGRPRKTGEAKRIPDPVPGDNGEALARIVDYFKKKHPDEWESLRLCPLQHGVEDMARLLNG